MRKLETRVDTTIQILSQILDQVNYIIINMQSLHNCVILLEIPMKILSSDQPEFNDDESDIEGITKSVILL